MATSDEEKGRRYMEKQRRYFAFLDATIPGLHRDGFPGVRARQEADRRYGLLLRGETVEAS